MFSFWKIRSLFLAIGFVVMLTIIPSSDVGSTASLGVFSSPSQTQIAFMSRSDAIAKNIEGRVQETIGNITDNNQDKIIGKAKQVESQLFTSANDLRDDMDFQTKSENLEKEIANKIQNLVNQ